VVNPEGLKRMIACSAGGGIGGMGGLILGAAGWMKQIFYVSLRRTGVL